MKHIKSIKILIEQITIVVLLYDIHFPLAISTFFNFCFSSISSSLKPTNIYQKKTPQNQEMCRMEISCRMFQGNLFLVFSLYTDQSRSMVPISRILVFFSEIY
uniref:Putative ovule protein n=1 Tax=Solanum chacoense TaxID=4108 RepID=A0A0V0GZZ3_SOLCH